MEDADQLLSGGVSVEEWQLITSTGPTITAEVSAAILPDGRWQAFVRDISDRKRMEQERARLVSELERERSLFATILENVPLGIVFVEAPFGKITFGNKQVEEILHRHIHSTAAIEPYRQWGGLSR